MELRSMMDLGTKARSPEFVDSEPRSGESGIDGYKGRWGNTFEIRLKKTWRSLASSNDFWKWPSILDTGKRCVSSFPQRAREWLQLLWNEQTLNGVGQQQFNSHEHCWNRGLSLSRKRKENIQFWCIYEPLVAFLCVWTWISAFHPLFHVRGCFMIP